MIVVALQILVWWLALDLIICILWAWWFGHIKDTP